MKLLDLIVHVGYLSAFGRHVPAGMSTATAETKVHRSFPKLLIRVRAAVNAAAGSRRSGETDAEYMQRLASDILRTGNFRFAFNPD